MTADELAPGKLIAQRYQLERLLGEGGMGSVWSATHMVTKKRVALKFLKANAADSPSNVRRFLREARAASAVRHPNVVEIHDIVELENGAPAMVMDLLLGESLAERLARQRPIDLGELAPLLLPVISAVGTAHSLGIVHRDIKPDNIFLERHVDGSVVPRILDFGIAKLSAQEGAAAETATLTRTGSVMGTPYYMAPEQVFGESDIDQRADVWAFGVILYEALAGRRPIDGDNFGQLFKAIATGNIVPLDRVMATLPIDITNLVARMLHKERDQRPRDLREVFEVLKRYADVKAASFAGARPPELDSLRDESAAAYAPTQTPVLTPEQFGANRGGTAMLADSGGAAAQSEADSAFARTDGNVRAKRSAFKGLALAAGVTLLGLGAFSVWQRGADTAESAAASALPPPSATPAAPAAPEPSVAEPAANPPPVAVSSTPSAAPAAAAPSSKKRVEQRAPAGTKAEPVSASAPAAPVAPAPAPNTKLPGGIAPNAPF